MNSIPDLSLIHDIKEREDSNKEIKRTLSPSPHWKFLVLNCMRQRGQPSALLSTCGSLSSEKLGNVNIPDVLVGVLNTLLQGRHVAPVLPVLAAKL